MAGPLDKPSLLGTKANLMQSLLLVSFAVDQDAHGVFLFCCAHVQGPGRTGSALGRHCKGLNYRGVLGLKSYLSQERKAIKGIE